MEQQQAAVQPEIKSNQEYFAPIQTASWRAVQREHLWTDFFPSF